jgi:hypothetical protein
MKNAFLRVGYTCASILAAGGLMMASAEQHDVATVNLSQPVMVGSTTLPGGHYTIVDEGNNLFLVRSDNGDQALVFGRKIEESKQAPKTELILKNDGEGLRLDQLVLEGETTGYEFKR